MHNRTPEVVGRSSLGLLLDDVTRTLAGKIATVKPFKSYTAEDDPNHLLGRPNGYTPKTAFTDSPRAADHTLSPTRAAPAD
ncbi:hypothetical protein AB0M83_23725 [Amycolatopsis sp. NPDC051106]|uniref:hypothetical protein n=1 Tax=unclassified Amycolatopsis TaxID=2618356 RepID=UPI003413199E